MMLSRWLGLGLAVVVCASGACKGKDGAAKAKAVATSKDFWPDAPPVTGAARPTTLRYQPENVGDYRLLIDVKTLSGPLKLKADMDLQLAFGPGPTARSRAGRFRGLTLDLDAMGQGMNMKLAGDELTMRTDGETMRFKRGEGGVFDVDKFLDLPFTTMTIGEDGKVGFEGNPGHPMTALGGDIMDTALILFPDLPPGEIPVGHAWTVTRQVSLGSGVGKVNVTYAFRYVGESACPSGTPACAALDFDASSTTGTVQTGSGPAKVKYSFAGKVYVDTARGAVDQSRVYMHMDVTIKGTSIVFGGLYGLTSS